MEEEKLTLEYEGEKFIKWCMNLRYSNKKQNAIKKYIDEGKDINYFSNVYGTNALRHLCDCLGFDLKNSSYIYDIAVLLIKSGRCKINDRNSNGNSTLHLLTRNFLTKDTFELFKMMISMDEIYLNCQNNCGETILMMLCKAFDSLFDINATELLINDKRCNLNLKDELSGKTALMHIPGARRCCGNILLNESILNLFKTFIANERCDLNLKDNDNKTVFDYVCHSKENTDLVKVLLEAGNRFILDESKVYPNHVIEQFSNQRNRIGVLLISIKNESKLSMKKKRKLNKMEENPLEIIPNELIHLILSYSHPLAPQTKYCLN